MKTLDTTPKLFAPDKAEAAAVVLQDSDPDWTYTADHDPKGTGYSRIAIHDEDGELVGYV